MRYLNILKSKGSNFFLTIMLFASVSLSAQTGLINRNCEYSDYTENCYVYPNPFSSSTNISFDLRQESDVTIEVYNISGSRIKSIVSNKIYPPGIHSVTLNANNLISGTYIVMVKTSTEQHLVKTVLLK